MKFLIALAMVVVIAACSSMRFTSHDGRVDGLNNIPDHGFLKTTKAGDICGGNSILTAGYVVHLRGPSSGETQSEYEKYVDAERVRASVCSKAALWCSSRSHYFCKPDDSTCLKERPGATRNTCKIKVLDAGNKPDLRPITEQIGDSTWIQCGGDSDGYESELAHTVVTEKAWVKDQAKWAQFCQQNRPKEECDLILQHYESPTWFSWPDASRWATEILIQEKPMVERDGDRWIGTVKIDLSPACPLMEKRY
jgi:hypothetical protein